MLEFNFQNFFSENIGNNHGLTKTDIEGLVRRIPEAHAKLLDWRKSKDALFFDIAFDDKLLDGIKEKASEVSSKFKNIVVLGIGGSALGLRCLSQALLTPMWNLASEKLRNNKPRLFVCDNIDPDSFSSLFNTIDIKKTCFIIISKSGKTIETAAQFFIVLEKLRKTLPNNWQEHFVIITDPSSGELRPFVEKEKIASFAIPPKLGGRFSVLSPVGMFPAACVGIDVAGVVDGARRMAKLCETVAFEDNPAYKIAGYNYLFDASKKKNISVMMTYSDALSLTADWYIQLWAESLGKKSKGSTPIKAVGATDQHSQVQLFMEGPFDKVFTIVGTKKFSGNKADTTINETIGSFDYLKSHDLATILNAEMSAITKALQKSQRPNMSIVFPEINATHIGEFFMTYEIATVFTGALYGVNPFDQPGVELGKVLTREILTK